VVHSETEEPEICRSAVGMSEVGMPAGAIVVDPDRRNEPTLKAVCTTAE